jgi:hypothetical protein
MKPVDFAEANCRLRAPEGMDNCVDLPFCKEEHEGLLIATSCWELSEEEVESIIKSKRVIVQVTGNSFPPMRLFVAKEEMK